MNVTLGVRAALLTLLALAAFLLLAPVGAQTGATDVRISASNADNNEVEFAPQRRNRQPHGSDAMSTALGATLRILVR